MFTYFILFGSDHWSPLGHNLMRTKCLCPSFYNMFIRCCCVHFAVKTLSTSTSRRFSRHSIVCLTFCPMKTCRGNMYVQWECLFVLCLLQTIWLAHRLAGIYCCLRCCYIRLIQSLKSISDIFTLNWNVKGR